MLASVHSGATICRRDHSGSCGITQARVSVVWFIWVRVGSLRHVYGPSGSFGFAWVHTGDSIGGTVHSCSRRISRAELGVAWFIRVPVGSLRRA